MRILICHNRYQNAGGEDAVVAAETALLREAGHEVCAYTRSNDELKARSTPGAALSSLWSRRSWKDITRLLASHRADVVHSHNTFAVLSPALYYAARQARVPVVQTIHNFRLLCPNALCFRNGQPCELCVGRAFAWHGIRYRCYRGDRAATATLAGMVGLHRLVGTWRKQVARYIALGSFARRKLVQGGLPANRISVVPNFAPFPQPEGDIPPTRAPFALFVGRLSEEKGVLPLLDAWTPHMDGIGLRVAGDGPLRDVVIRRAAACPSVTYLGWQSPAAVEALMRIARFLVVPSICYEGFPVVLAEALALGLPALASRIGGLPDIVADGQTGLLFPPNDPAALADTVTKAWTLSEARYQAMRTACRDRHRARYSPESHLKQLMEVYRLAGAISP